MKKITTFLLILLFGVFLVAGSAMALPVLTVSDDFGNTQDFYDLDGNGVITTGEFSLGVWGVSITTGITEPMYGSEDYPIMHLDTVNVSSGGAGLLTITFEDDFDIDNLTSFAGFYTSFGGLTSGSVVLDAYWNETTLLAHLVSSGSVFGDATAFTGLLTDLNGDDPSDSDQVIKLVATITHGGVGATSFNAEIKPVPEPATMILFGAGLVGLGAYGRKRFSKRR